MTDSPSEYPTPDSESGADYFTVNMPLHAVRPGYIRRAADDALFGAITQGRYAHIIAPNRTGKTSLIAATSARLQNNGYKVAVLDLGQISERDGGSDSGRWYYSFAYRLLRQLRLKIDLQSWWQDKSIFSNRQRLVEFYIEVILQYIDEQVVIFLDEIQSVIDKPFSEHLLASIREAQNSRVTDPEFQRLTFVLAGECDPLSLDPQAATSPFAQSQEIRITDFSRDDLDAFAMELNLSSSDAAIALDRIYYWTSGHPYLSQKLARAIARDRISHGIKEQVDRIAMQQLAGRAALHSEPHMSLVHRRVVGDRKTSEALLNLYGRLRKGVTVEYDPESRPQRMLLAIGLVLVDEQGRLRIRNRLYRAVFTARWANENLPLHWRGPAIAALILIVLTAVPFWYTQLLPRPYMRVLANPQLALDSVYQAYVNMHSFPGHASSAERLFRNHLELRSVQTREVEAMLEIDRYARELPDSQLFADRLAANFWDERAQDALRAENRDAALLAALESLVVSTSPRRRRAASLIGDDYSLLLGTVPPQDAERLVFDPDNLLISYADAAELRQWSMTDGGLEARQQWTVSALEVLPLLRRVTVDRSGSATQIRLRVDVDHSRLDDLRLRLIAPSGRAADLLFAVPATAGDVVTFAGGQLAPLVGEALQGTWSLSLRDEAAGVIGQLNGWELTLNGLTLPEDFDRGLDIPDPVARASDELWFSPDGRYAIARAKQSDSARLWDLAYARAARTVAVPASEQVLGLDANAEHMVTLAQNAVHLWRSTDGRRMSVIDIGVGAVSSNIAMTPDGQHVLVMHRGDDNTNFRLWSLADGNIVARHAVAGIPARVAVDGGGHHLAVADFDRTIRVWNMRSGELLSQIDLLEQPTSMRLSANGDVLGVVHGNSGVSLWNTRKPQAPLMRERGIGDWQLTFSPSGASLLAGNSRQGFQVYRSADGARAGPPLGSDLRPGPANLLSFSRDERILVIGDPRGRTRAWRVPVAGRVATGEADGKRDWREAGDSIYAIGPGGDRLAVGDNQGHVHIVQVDAAKEEGPDPGDDLSYLGHQGPVVGLVFSEDGSLVASAGATGTVRVWDTATGAPRSYYGGATASTVDLMEFSPDSQRLAVLSGRRAWVMNVENGDVLADVELGALHSALAFASPERLYLGDEEGNLRLLAADRTGGWALRNLWSGQAPLRQLELSKEQELLVLVDASNLARLLDLRSGRIGTATLRLPDAVTDVAFSPNESRVLLRTARWIHRATASPAGLTWLDAIRTPKVITGSGMVFAQTSRRGTRQADPLGNRVMLLTRDAGTAEVAVLDFNYQSGTTVFGTRERLVEEWRRKLGRSAPPTIQAGSVP